MLRNRTGPATIHLDGAEMAVSLALWIFTNATKPVEATLKTLSIRIIMHIGDLPAVAPGKDMAQEQTDCLMFLSESLGFTVNRQKCMTGPRQEINFLSLPGTAVLTKLRLLGLYI